MSDLFKDHKPELTEEEDRLLWQRVRAIPALEPAPDVRPAPWWRRLFELPAVRYGAPAFAVLLAAVIYVVERAPAPTLKVEPAPQAAPPAEPRRVVVMPPPVVTADPERVDRPVPEAGAPRFATPAPKIKARADVSKDVAAHDGLTAGNAAESRQEAPPAAPQTAALKKTFAAPPQPGAVKEQAQRSTAQSAPAAPTLGALGDRGGRSGAVLRSGLDGSGVPDRLMRGVLPSADELAMHPVVRSASSVDPTVARVSPLPPDLETSALKRQVDGRVRSYEQAAPAVQAAAIALAFERALANPSGTPRARVAAMLAHARSIEARAGRADQPGAARLVAMLEGALGAWPAN
jgi:hypothetical protein